jgi:hypothetical protein
MRRESEPVVGRAGFVSSLNLSTNTVRPELVEGLFLLFSPKKKQGFDKLSPNGVKGLSRSRIF